MKIITSPELKKVVKAAIASGQWTLEDGSKHQRIRHVNGRMVTFAASSSDRRACLYLARDIRHIEKGIPGWGQQQEVTETISLKHR